MNPPEKLSLEEAFQLVYKQLKQIAHRQKLRFHSLDTLNTTAIVHEAYEKLGKQTAPVYEGKTHFYRAAAKAMRHLLINYSEWKTAKKRGAGVPNEDWMEWEEKISLSESSMENLLAINELLKQLEHMAPRQFQVVEARFFGGMTIEETAQALNISPATAKRDWTVAKAWMYRQLKEKDNS